MAKPKEKSASDRALDAVEGIVGDLKRSAAKLGPNALEAARGAVRTNGLNYLISGWVGAAVMVVGAGVAAAAWYNMPDAIVAACNKMQWQDAYTCREQIKDARFPHWAGVIGGGLVAFCGWFTVYSYLFDAWTWTMMKNPDLWIADRVLDRFIDPPSNDEG